MSYMSEWQGVLTERVPAVYEYIHLYISILNFVIHKEERENIQLAIDNDETDASLHT